MASYVAFISGIVKFSSPSFSWALAEKKCFHFFLLSYHCFTKHLRFSFETLHDGGDSFSILYEFLGAYLCLWCSSFLRQNLLERCSSLVDFSSFFFSCSIDSLPINFVVEFFLDELFSQGWCGEEPGYLHYFMETPHKTGVCDWGCWSLLCWANQERQLLPLEPLSTPHVSQAAVCQVLHVTAYLSEHLISFHSTVSNVLVLSQPPPRVGHPLAWVCPALVLPWRSLWMAQCFLPLAVFLILFQSLELEVFPHLIKDRELLFHIFFSFLFLF